MGEKKETRQKTTENDTGSYTRAEPVRLVEKKSRFIACTHPVSSEEEALAFVEEIRKKYWDARHHCWAYIIRRERGRRAAAAMTGNPAQTAGKPMLDVLLGSETHGMCAGSDQVFRRNPCSEQEDWFGHIPRGCQGGAGKAALP